MFIVKFVRVHVYSCFQCSVDIVICFHLLAQRVGEVKTINVSKKVLGYSNTVSIVTQTRNFSHKFFTPRKLRVSDCNKIIHIYTNKFCFSGFCMHHC